MAERKQTPNILGEILSGSGSSAELPAPAVPAAQPTKPPSPPQPARPARPAAAPKAADKTRWEYLVVSFHAQNGWHARFINGHELKDWTRGPQLHDVLDQLGAEGWELVTLTKAEPLYGTMDRMQAYFKRLQQ